ncbi:MAG: VWA domain-containing protein [Planctomycetaceae bacterium]|nr:VWA domain-containing protein [Planctomycetaceae bacterium]
MDTLSLFRRPEALVLLVVPIGLVVWHLVAARRGVAVPVDGGGARPRPGWSRAVTAAGLLPALLLGAAVLLLAEPQRFGAPRSKRVLTNIQFCVDVSGSMTAPFEGGNRYDAAMAAINGFLDYREGDAFGLTFFGHNVLHWVPLTSDVSAFRCAPPFMEPGKIPPWFNGTLIGKALLACRKELVEREEGDRMVLLISDGQSADLWGGRDEEIARQLVEDGIVVYAVHIAPGGIPDQVVRLASLTGGEAFKPEDRDGLARVFQRIDQMQKTRLEKTRPEAIDHFEPFALGGLGVLGLFLLASFALRPTPW